MSLFKQFTHVSITVTDVAKAREFYVETDLRDRLARYHADPDSAFRGWNDIWLAPEFVHWRIDATNILNRVTYSGLNTIVGSPQFGLPNRANAMRKLLSSLSDTPVA